MADAANALITKVNTPPHSGGWESFEFGASISNN